MSSITPAETDIEEGIAPWDGRRVPMTLIGGYLGSGKTTILNDLLRKTDRPIAVLVNDVGEINIDARLLRRRGAASFGLRKPKNTRMSHFSLMVVTKPSAKAKTAPWCHRHM